MIFPKRIFLILSCILSLTSALICRVCEKDDPSCVHAADADIRQCDNEDDLCYSWFYRTGIDVGVQRDCMSITTPAYSLIKTMIYDKDSGCVKRIRGLDCFSFCSTDLCN